MPKRALLSEIEAVASEWEKQAADIEAAGPREPEEREREYAQVVASLEILHHGAPDRMTPLLFVQVLERRLAGLPGGPDVIAGRIGLQHLRERVAELERERADIVARLEAEIAMPIVVGESSTAVEAGSIV